MTKRMKPKDCHWSEAKYDRCIKDVGKKGDGNPFAICSASCLGTTDRGRRKKKNKR